MHNRNLSLEVDEEEQCQLVIKLKHMSKVKTSL